jgi:hypothetical protein
MRLRRICTSLFRWWHFYYITYYYIAACTLQSRTPPLFTSTESQSRIINSPPLPFHLPSADHSQAYSDSLGNFLRHFGLYLHLHLWTERSCVHNVQSIFSYVCCSWLCSERLERGGHSWLLKLRHMGTLGVNMKGGHSLAGLLDSLFRYKRFCPAMAALIGSVPKKFPYP